MNTPLNLRLTSRPDEEESTIALAALSDAELELMAAFLCCTRLGHNISPYRDAAFELIKKIEELRGDDFLDHASSNVDLTVDVMDQHGSLIETLSQDSLEFVV